MRNYEDLDREFQQAWNDNKKKRATYAKWVWIFVALRLIGAVLALILLALVVYILARFAGVI